MKIAVVGQHEWYGCMGTWVADGFEMNGHEVARIDRNNIALSPKQFDILFYVDCSEDYSSLIPKCKNCPPKIFWSLDAHMPGGSERSCNIARKCDLVFSSNYEHGVKILGKFGIESVLMPITYNTYLHNYDEKEKDIDFAMIGHPNSPERLRLWDILKNYNSVIGKVDTKDQYIDTMHRARIVINQPTEPWDMILNNRFFEAMGCGALLLQKKLSTNLIEKLGFESGKHFFYWDSLNELKITLERFKDKRSQPIINRIVSKSISKVIKYSMKNQCAKIEAIILSKFYDRL